MSEPGDEPIVEPIDGGVRWTFSTDDRAEQEDQFSHWCGWFGFDERETPYEISGNTWLFTTRMRN